MQGPSQRIPAKIVPERDMHITPGREGSLISEKTFRKIRRHQAHEQLTGLYNKQTGKQEAVRVPVKGRFFLLKGEKHPFYIGENNEIIAIMQGESFKLGQGAFSVAFMGMDLETGKFVVIKYQNINRFEEEESREKIAKEINTMKELRRLISSIEDPKNQRTIIVDELAWGKTYSECIKDLKGKTDTQSQLTRMNMSLGLLEKVKALHISGFIHRDIKPDNVMWDEQTSTTKLIDFGETMKIPTLSEPNQIFHASHAGSPLYIAPEVLTGEISTLTELYACGVVMIELFSNDNIRHKAGEWKQKHDQFLFKYVRIGVQPEGPDKTAALADLNQEIKSYMSEYIKNNAKDIFAKDAPEALKQIFQIIQQAVSSELSDRPSFDQVITIIRDHKYQLEFDIFKQVIIDTDVTFSIKPSDMENPLICQYFFDHADDSAFISRIVNPHVKSAPDQSSLYLLIRAAAQAGNESVFSRISDKMNLLAVYNRGYALQILPILIARTLSNPNDPLMQHYIQSAIAQGRLDETSKDIQNAFKSKDIKNILGDKKPPTTVKFIQNFIENKQVLSARNQPLIYQSQPLREPDILTEPSDTENISPSKNPHKI